MVQISRSTLRGGGGGGESSSPYCCGRAFRRGLFGLLRFLVTSAFIPSVFLIRYYWFSDSDNTIGGTSLRPPVNIDHDQSLVPSHASAATTSNVGSVRAGGSSPGAPQQSTEQQKNNAAALAAAAERERTNMFDFLNEIDFTATGATKKQQHRALAESDIVQLDHCRITAVDMNNFTTWAFPLVNDTVTQLLRSYQREEPDEADQPSRIDSDVKDSHDESNMNNAASVQSWNKMTTRQQDELRLAMEQEFVLELLEQYAHHAGYCDFTSAVYHPTVPNDNDSGGFTQRAATRLRAAEKQHARKSSPLLGKNTNKRVVALVETDDDNEQGAPNEHDEDNDDEETTLRLVISILAFQDVDQLRRLVQAVHMPQHYIIIHVEQRASVQFIESIQREILHTNGNEEEKFSNVVLLQFGTIVYRTDSVSMTNLRIMRWITLDLQLDYDYYVTLDGSSFPLQSAQELHSGLQRLAIHRNDKNKHQQEGGRFLDQESPFADSNDINGQETVDDDIVLRADAVQHTHDMMAATDNYNSKSDPATTVEGGGASVWLGSLLHKGVAVDSPQWHLLLQKRLVFTRNIMVDPVSSLSTSSLSYPKLHKRLPRSTFTSAAAPFPSSPIVPSEVIRTHMTKKSISGNQGVFRRNVVQQLLTSPDVMELFALSKYACCCCVEERNWIAALGIISNSVDSGSMGEQQGRSAINYQQEALRQSSTFELWGGEGKECVSSMKNAVLTRNASICYKIDDHILVQAATGSATAPTIADTSSTSTPRQHYFYGNETWSYLKLAKSKGYFFARKFDSAQPQSMSLLNDIQSELWE